MYLNIEEPTREISAKAIRVWRITNTIGHSTVILILAVCVYFDSLYQWPEWAGYLIYGLMALMAISAVFSIAVEPVYLQRTWRYEIDEEFIQLKHGRITQKHILIPMTKVEVVSTSQGPFLRKYGLYDVNIGAVNSSHTIPSIEKEEALKLRNQIAIYAKVGEQDELEDGS
ncbi:PH domain-containing protein [Metabacillus sp. 113a]|uniref:PH domain-containing protein n=1 Tax=Metabacillus sp. 113a TaxID=3404706 RepID=UPI003CED5D67